MSNLLKIKKFIRQITSEKLFQKIKFSYRKYIIRKRDVIFYLSFQCNYHCPYCVIRRAGYSNIYPRLSEHAWQEWIRVFKKMPPLIISLSGGEPFLNHDLIELLNQMPKKHTVNMTTNLSLPIDDFIAQIKRKPQITASLHAYEANLDIFKKRVLQLKRAGFSIFINFVGYPQKIHLIPELKIFFEQHQIIFNVDPYIDPGYKYSADEIAVIKKYAKKFRSLGFEEDRRPKLCYAGSRHLVIVPNGDVYACQSGFYYNTSKLHQRFAVSHNFCLGNLFVGTFRFLNQPIVCSLPCNEACDIESAFVKKLTNNKSSF